MSLNEPPVDKLIDKLGNKYALSVLVAKRAKEISISRSEFFNENRRIKPVSVASSEFFDGVVKKPE
ncbi:MAG: DNA-directed RNA polymerase subunit omega [Clostridia bacterium]|nr:DNA-directed RNA polymerase subunit omega [Clostridia bacterium]